MQFVEESRVMLAVILCSSLSMQRRSTVFVLAVVVRLVVAMELVLVLRLSS